MTHPYTVQEDEPDFLLADLAERHGYKLSELRTERRKGRLKVMRIAGKLRSTDSAIREMRRLCLEELKAPDCTSGEPGPTRSQPGSSSTGDVKRAQDALQATVRALKKRSPTTSPTNTSRRGQVVTLPRP